MDSISINQGRLFNSQSNQRKQNGKNKISSSAGINNNSGNNQNVIENFALEKQPDTFSAYAYNKIDKKLKSEDAKMKSIIKDIDKAKDNAITVQNNTTSVAQNFIKAKDAGLTKNIVSKDGVPGNLNRVGVFSPYSSNSNTDTTNFANSDINVYGSIQSDYANTNNTGISLVYPVLSSDPSGKKNGIADVALLGNNSALLSPDVQNTIGGFAGLNTYVNEPADFKYVNIQYNYALNGTSLQPESDMSNVTARQCFQRAIDKAGTNTTVYAAISDLETGTNTGQCYTGVSMGFNNNYSFSDPISIPVTDLTNTVVGDNITTALLFGANGGLYDGYPTNNNSNLLITLPQDILNTVDPIHGALLNTTNGTYGLNSGSGNTNNMLFTDSVVNNSNVTGRPSATLATINTTQSTQENCDWPWWLPGFLRNPEFSWYNHYCSSNSVTNYNTILNEGNQSAAQNVNLTYNCGKKTITLNQADVAAGTQVPIDCSEFINKYGPFTIELTNDGVIKIKNLANMSENNGIVWQSENQQALLNQTVTLKNGQPVLLNVSNPAWVNGSGITSLNSTTPSLIFATSTNNVFYIEPNNFISSPSGNCRMILLKKSDSDKNQLFIQYALYNVKQDADGYLIGYTAGTQNGNTSYSYAHYTINNVNATNLGNLSYVDINNNVFQYPVPPSGSYPNDNTYYEMKNFTPSTSALGTAQPLTTQTCDTICSNNTNCGGYVLNQGKCTTYNQSDIFPLGTRLYAGDNSGSSTFIRSKKVTPEMSDSSCSKTINNIDSGMFSMFGQYLSGSQMAIDKKCGLGLVIEQQQKILETKNNDVVNKGNAIKDQVADIYTKQNKVVDYLNTNDKNGKRLMKESDKIQKATEKIKNINISKVASKEDTDLLLISDNYKYISWGIITIIMSIYSIKALRIASN